MAANSSTIHSTFFPSFLKASSPVRVRYRYRNGTHPAAETPTICSAFRRKTNGRDFGYCQLVDENMITLRKRMHEAKLAERNYEPPADWMEWEKRYYTQYGTDVFELMGLLQGLLIKTRPSLAIGVVVLFMVSVPTSTILGFRLLIDVWSFVFSQMNLS